MSDICKEAEFGFKDILLMTFLYFVQQFLLLAFGAQDKGTYQQGSQQKQAQGINQISPPGSIPRVADTDDQRVDITLFIKDTIIVFHQQRIFAGSHIRKRHSALRTVVHPLVAQTFQLIEIGAVVTIQIIHRSKGDRKEVLIVLQVQHLRILFPGEKFAQVILFAKDG